MAPTTFDRPVPTWFDDAKFGIFVHWTAAAVPAFAPVTDSPFDVASSAGWEESLKQMPYVEWYQNSLNIPGSPVAEHHAATYGDAPYDDFVGQFCAGHGGWRPDLWADLFKAAGAEYVVFVTKHHDGVLLWPSATPNPFKAGWGSERDLVGELAGAVRDRGMRFGVYYSGGLDWTFGGLPITDLRSLIVAIPQTEAYLAYANGHWKELIERYEPCSMWNDIGYPSATDYDDLFGFFYERVPDGVINNRFDMIKQTSGQLHCDFITPEYSTKGGAGRKFEVCRGLGTSFGYNRGEDDSTYLSSAALVETLVDIVARGGNFLLNVGPTGIGRVPWAQAERLRAMGEWLSVNGEAIYGTRPWGPTGAETADGLRVRFTSSGDGVYAILLDVPKAREAVIPEVRLNEGTVVRQLGHDANLVAQPVEAGGVRVTLPEVPDSQPALTLAFKGLIAAVADVEPAEEPARPRNAVVVLLDSLNRHLLGAYGSDEFATPNLDRFASDALRFERHYTGSLPCIPARHDLLCGALDFLWRPWGSIELWEDPLTVQLRRAGVTTMLVTDHPHLFETGGENYHVDFTAWDYQRGHESDLWKTRPDPSWVGAPTTSGDIRDAMPYARSRTWFRGEEDFPGPRTMAAAARWLDDSAPAHDRFLLFVDEFDPHEPFDTPEPYASLYDPDWTGPHLIWPPYQKGAVAAGTLTERDGRQVRASYGAKLTMIDHWFGRMLDALDRQHLWDDTAVIVCTDHGHYLGEKDIWGKPAVPVYEPMGHIPLLVRWPGAPPRSIPALTTSVDIHATLADLFGVRAEHVTHGHSLIPLIDGRAAEIREAVLTGIWGREVNLVDKDTMYARAPSGPNAPLSMWSNRWSTMPIAIAPDIRMPRPDDRAFLDRMPGSSVPVIRQPFGPGDAVPFWAGFGRFDGNHLYDLRDDPDEDRNLASTPAEKDAEEKLREHLRAVSAPDDQFVRLGFP